jgi:hypothetical protein
VREGLFRRFISSNLLQSIVESRKPGGGDGTSDGTGEGVKVLPASFLEESYSASETIAMTTIDQEQYTCVLPDLTGEAAPKVQSSGR